MEDSTNYLARPPTAPLGGPPITPRAAGSRVGLPQSGSVRGPTAPDTPRTVPRHGWEGPGGEVGEDGASTAFVLQPLPGACSPAGRRAGRGSKVSRAPCLGAGAPWRRPPLCAGRCPEAASSATAVRPTL